jgi:hypothetical protein
MRFNILFGCLLALTLNAAPASAGTVLIKSDEAALPPPTSTANLPLITRALTRRPSVTLLSPEAGVTSPFNLKVKFRAHGGSTIKPDSFKAIYLKNPNIDLTSRIAAFVTANGVDMIGAEAPPGRHMIEVKIADSDSRETSAIFVLNVIK